MNFEILPGKGLGDLRFGQTQDEVRACIGDASSLDRADGECVVWCYDALGIELEFSADAEGRLTHIDVDALEVSVLGVRPLGLNEEEATAVLDGLATLEPDPEMSDARRSACRVVAPAAPGEIVLRFGDGVCDAASVSAVVDAEGFYVWPDDV